MGNCQIDEKGRNYKVEERQFEENTCDYNDDLEEKTFPFRTEFTSQTLSSASRQLLTHPNLLQTQQNILSPNKVESVIKEPSLESESLNKIEVIKKIQSTSKRVKLKRPSFKIVRFDYNNFIVKKKSSIWDDYILGKKIGSGSYGSVYLSEERKTKDRKAIKCINKANLTQDEFQNMINEFEILRNMDHPNIIKLYEIYEDANKLYVVTELCQGGNLLELIKYHQLSQDAIRNIMVQLLSAVSYMQSQHILHRDIKLDNIVIVGCVIQENIQRIQIKLIDFGISMNLGKQEATFSQFLYGTLLYMPPESLKGTISINWDIWSCGIACYILVTKEFPYKYRSDDELSSKIMKVNINRKNLHGVAKDLVHFIMSMLNKSYMMRLPASKVLKDPWLLKKAHNFQLSKSVKQQTIINLQQYDAKNNFISMIQGYLVAKKINQAERQHLASIFESIDQDHSGIIQVEEFRKFYQENSEYYNAEEVEDLLVMLDKNKSGKIDFNQFISAMCSRRKLFQLQSLSEAFDFVDRDQSGQISREEIQELLRGIEDSQIEQLFKILDSDGSSTISKTEFLSYFQKMIKE